MLCNLLASRISGESRPTGTLRQIRNIVFAWFINLRLSPHIFALHFCIFCIRNSAYFSQVDDEVDWSVLKPDIFAAIMDFFATEQPILSKKVNEETASDGDTG